MKNKQKLESLLLSGESKGSGDIPTSYAHGLVSTAVYSGLVAIADLLFSAHLQFQNMHPAGDIAIGSGVLAGRISKTNYSKVPKAKYGELAASVTGFAASLAPAMPFISVAPKTALFIGGLRVVEYCIGAAVGYLFAFPPEWYRISNKTEDKGLQSLKFRT